MYFVILGILVYLLWLCSFSSYNQQLEVFFFFFDCTTIVTCSLLQRSIGEKGKMNISHDFSSIKCLPVGRLQNKRLEFVIQNKSVHPVCIFTLPVF